MDGSTFLVREDDSRRALFAWRQQRAALALFSPPYAGKRGAPDPDDYVQWFTPVIAGLAEAVDPAGSVALNVKECVGRKGKYKGERHPYVAQLVARFREHGWKHIEEYVWYRTNSMPGRFGPRTKDAFERVLHFSRVSKPYVDVDAVRVPYKTGPAEVAARQRRDQPRKATAAGFGRRRAATYARGGADPGNVVAVPQTYNQHRGPAGVHDAVMPEGLARFFVRLLCPPGGLVLDPFCGSGTTLAVALEEGRHAYGIDNDRSHVSYARARCTAVLGRRST